MATSGRRRFVAQVDELAAAKNLSVELGMDVYAQRAGDLLATVTRP